MTEARRAGERGEVPIGAAVVLDSKVIATTGNRTRELNDITAHAEIVAIRLACEELGQERLAGADLYVTLEPCTQVTDADCAICRRPWLERSCAIAPPRSP